MEVPIFSWSMCLEEQDEEEDNDDAQEIEVIEIEKVVLSTSHKN